MLKPHLPEWAGLQMGKWCIIMLTDDGQIRTLGSPIL